MSAPQIPKLTAFRTVETFREHIRALEIPLDCDERILTGDDSPLAAPGTIGEFTVGNRWCIQPMEGWDGTDEGKPTEHTFRRWRNFGISGAKLIWGGEAVAVRHDGRANPHQLLYCARNKGALAALRQALIDAHRERFGSTDGLVVGLQLTHSGRFCRPNESSRLEPRTVYAHPLLDRKFAIDPRKAILTDEQIDEVVECFAAAAKGAREIGFDFVDVKHCHGYLGHEFLSARARAGRYGGSFAGRTRFLRNVVEAIRREAPGLAIGVRVSAFDFVPFRPDPALSRGRKLGPGIPEPTDGAMPYTCGFGTDPDNPVAWDLAEPIRFLKLLAELGVICANISAGSPYYSPHIQRPAIYPPSDGYQPPEDPLLGCSRQIECVRQLKQAVSELPLVGSGYSYLQEYLPHVAQKAVREGWVDFVGIGRMVLSYPDLPADTLEKGTLDRRRICRTFSDCTTAPRNGMVSGCFPLDPYYKALPEAQRLKEIKDSLEA